MWYVKFFEYIPFLYLFSNTKLPLFIILSISIVSFLPVKALEESRMSSFTSDTVVQYFGSGFRV